MSAAAAVNLPTNEGKSLAIATIRGRIDSIRSRKTADGTVRFALLKLPAPDAFTAPATVEVSYRDPIGEIGDEITVRVRVGGYGRIVTPQKADRQTGEIGRPYRTADNTLQVVEG